MEYDACIMFLVRAGIHESSVILGTLVRVSWFFVLPSGGPGNRGSIKEANGVTGQMRMDMSKKWQCRW